MPLEPLIHIIILTHNNIHYTLETLQSLADNNYRNYKILIVDNASSDGTVGAVRAEYPKVEFLLHTQNKGFAGGVNAGLKQVLTQEGDLILLLNNDVTLAPRMLHHLVSVLEPGIGAAGPMIYYLNEPQKIWSVGFTRHPLLLEMRGGGRNQEDRGQWTQPFSVDYLPGCVFLLTRELIERVGLFDERYFFYYEDLDYCLRAHNEGFRLVTVPRAKAWHHVSGTAGLSSPFQIYHRARGSVIFFRTHTQGLQKPAAFLYRTGSAIKSLLALAGKRDFHLASLYMQGIQDGWKTTLKLR